MGHNRAKNIDFGVFWEIKLKNFQIKCNVTSLFLGEEEEKRNFILIFKHEI